MTATKATREKPTLTLHAVGSEHPGEKGSSAPRSPGTALGTALLRCGPSPQTGQL